MKNLLLIALLVFSVHAFAQDSGTKKHEIGLSLYSLTNVVNYTSGGDIFFKYLPKNNFVNSFQYKYHWEKVSLRANLNYQYHNFPDDVAPNEFVEGDLYYGEIWTLGTRVGIERRFGNSKLKPIIALDVFYNFGKNTATPFYWGGPNIDLINIPGSTISHSGGISPSVGIVYQIIPSLSVRLESNGEMGWYKQGYEYSNENVSAGIYVMYNAVSTFSINFQF